MYINVGTVKMTKGTVEFNFAQSGPGGNNPNVGGGGIFIVAGSLTLSGVAIEQNIALGNGGGLNVRGGTVSMMGGTIFDNGVPGTSNGGGIYVNSGALTLKGAVNIRENLATTGGPAAGATGCGGGLYINGGTVNISGPAMGNPNNSSLSIEGNEAQNNGGGIYNYGGILTLQGVNWVQDNKAGNDGGGLYLDKQSTTTFTGPLLQCQGEHSRGHWAGRLLAVSRHRGELGQSQRWERPHGTG